MKRIYITKSNPSGYKEVKNYWIRRFNNTNHQGRMETEDAMLIFQHIIITINTFLAFKSKRFRS